MKDARGDGPQQEPKVEQREIDMETMGTLVLARIEIFDSSRDAWSTVAYVVRDSDTWQRSFKTGSKPNEAFAAARQFLREMATFNA